jgi:hypothetical protein
MSRLAATPEDFLAEPRIGQRGRVQTVAVVGDLLRLLDASVSPEELAPFATGYLSSLAVSELPEHAEKEPPAFAEARRERNRMAITLILCWLLSDEEIGRLKPDAAVVLALLRECAGQLAGLQASRKFVTDPDRREELARLALARLGYRPAGETLAQAQDRLTTLNSTERARVVQAARAAEERARKIREALVKKAAQESADKWTRE